MHGSTTSTEASIKLFTILDTKLPSDTCLTEEKEGNAVTSKIIKSTRPTLIPMQSSG